MYNFLTQIFNGNEWNTWNVVIRNYLAEPTLVWHFRIYALSGNYPAINVELYGCGKNPCLILTVHFVTFST